jgi:hypothetical protein
MSLSDLIYVIMLENIGTEIQISLPDSKAYF